MLIAFNKPYDVLSQFTRELPTHHTLADYNLPKHVYPIGRLDRDSEGLLLLSDEAQYTDRLLHPRHAHRRTYHAQVEGEVSPEALSRLRAGRLDLGDFSTLPCEVTRISPEYEERTPPVRFRKTVPTNWLTLTLTEGKNRQVRRMTAAVGHPTLRLIRVAIGQLQLSDLHLAPGQWRELTPAEIKAVLAK